MSSPQSSGLRQVGQQLGVCARRPRPGRAPARRAARPTGEIVVREGLAEERPERLTYSQAWMSRADQSLTRHDAEDVLREPRTGTGLPSVDCRRPTTKPSSASKSSLRRRAEHGAGAPAGLRWPHGRRTGVPETTTVPGAAVVADRAGAASSASAARRPGRKIRPTLVAWCSEA